MNRSYEIDKRTVVVTDEHGRKRMIPKYKRAEEILVLENDIGEIERIISEKRDVIEKNKTDKQCLHYEKNAKMSKITWLIGIALIFLGGFISMMQILTFVFKPFLCIGLASWIIGFVFYGNECKANKLNYENKQLSEDIEWLEQLKEQKVSKMVTLQKTINQRLLVQDEKQLPEPVNPLEILKKIREYLKEEKVDVELYPLLQQMVETKEKQKTLHIS